MKFTKLEKNLSHVSELPDTPTLENGYTPKALKETFDRAGEDIKEYINSVLISELETDGANKIGSGDIETVGGASVQDKLENLALQIKDISNASIPEGTLVPEKFVPTVASFITEGSPKYAYFSKAGDYVFVPTRSGTYKITVQGAGAGGGTYGNYGGSCGGGSGAAAIGWMRLESGHEYTAHVGRGGKSITLSDTNKYLSAPEDGEASGFYDADEELLYAEGGRTQKNMPTPLARGGVINMTGEYPVSTAYASGIQHYSYGAGSHLASSVSSSDVEPGAGAGGYGSTYSVSIGYTSSGTAGGDGAILIEWME